MKDVQIIELGNEDIEVILDSYALTWSEILGNPTNSKPLVELLNKLLAEKISKRVEPLVAGTHSKITYDENGLVVAGEDLSIEDLPELHLNNIVDVEATSEEVNKLHGLQATKNEIDRLHDITATTSELNILHGLQANTEELNRLKGLLIASAQLNMLQGIKSNVQAQLDKKMDKINYEVENKANKTNSYDTASNETYPSSKALKAGLDTKQDKLTETQLNNLNKAVTTENIEEAVSGKLDKNAPIQPDEACKVEYDENGLIIGKKNLEETDIPAIKLNKISDVNVSASELNQLKGLEADANDLNQLKGVENNVQLQFDTITQLLPDEVTVDNKLADKQYVKNYVYDTAGFFLSKDAHNTPFKSMAELLNTHTFYDNGKIKRISEHDYTVVTSDETRNNSVSLYAWIRDEIYNEGHWVFQYKISNSYDDLTFDWGNIVGNIINQTDLMKEFKKRDTAFTTHKEDKDNPHKVTKRQVGLGNVDNTSDADKPISTATQSALDEKQGIITDLETIREGATLGSTALQTEIDPVYTADKPNIALKSEIPTKVSELTNDSNYITKTETNTLLNSKQDKGDYAFKSEIPTKVSSLDNDAKYQTEVDVASMIASIPQFELKIVDALPLQGQRMVLYLVPKTSASGDNIYDEYIWIESTSSFEIIGSTTVDLSDYATKDELNLKVGNDEFVGIKDLTKTLTAKAKVSSFTTLGLNAIGSDSTYQATPINSGQSHWSSNANSGLKIYIAFDKPTNVNAINLNLNDTTIYGYPQINIYGGNSIADTTTNLLFNEKAVAGVNACNLGDVEYQYFLIDLTHTNWINCMYAYVMKKKDGIIRAEDYQQIKNDITQHSNAIARKEDKPTITKSNNTSGVIKHTDGRMEQWGLATSSTTGETEFTINANFIDTDFQVFIEPRQADNSVHYAIPSATNKFKARIQNTSGSDMTCQFQWRAYGFWR